MRARRVSTHRAAARRIGRSDFASSFDVFRGGLMVTTLSRFIRHDLMCTDVPAGTRFYSELFGWQTTEVKVMGFTVVRVSAGSVVLGAIMPFDARLGHPSHWVPYVYVGSVEECCQRISELGGEVCMGATQIPPG